MKSTSISQFLNQICLALAAFFMVLVFSLFNSSIVIPLAKVMVPLLSSILSSVKMAANEALFNV
jgi:hypothetical protein